MYYRLLLLFYDLYYLNLGTRTTWLLISLILQENYEDDM